MAMLKELLILILIILIAITIISILLHILFFVLFSKEYIEMIKEFLDKKKNKR